MSKQGGDNPSLSRREREIMDVLFRLGEGSVADVRDAMTEAPSYSAVRALLNLLLEKGHLRHRRVDRKYVYRPKVAPGRARRNAFRHLVTTFFDGSIEKAVSFFLDAEAQGLDEDELERLARRIEAARRETKGREDEGSSPSGD